MTKATTAITAAAAPTSTGWGNAVTLTAGNVPGAGDRLDRLHLGRHNAVHGDPAGAQSCLTSSTLRAAAPTR